MNTCQLITKDGTFSFHAARLRLHFWDDTSSSGTFVAPSCDTCIPFPWTCTVPGSLTGIPLPLAREPPPPHTCIPFLGTCTLPPSLVAHVPFPLARVPPPLTHTSLSLGRLLILRKLLWTSMSLHECTDPSAVKGGEEKRGGCGWVPIHHKGKWKKVSD